MNGISHKQAVQYIDRGVDGLLDESQRSALDEHLRSCDSCRAYATDMEGLSAHLQNEFYRRWDMQPGPSQNVSDRVTAQAGKLLMRNRIAANTKLFAGALALITLGIAINFVISRLQDTSPVTDPTEPATSSPLATDRLLAFASDQNGNSDIYTMHADGSGLTNLTNNPAMDTQPVWSPNGERIAFVSDRDGSLQIYLMDADGSNVVRLTKDEASHAFSNYVNNFDPWSPDGSKLVFSEAIPGETNWMLYVLDIHSGNKTPLVDEPNVYSVISWSPNGKYVALQAQDHQDQHQNQSVNRLYVVNADGSGLREITESLPQNIQHIFDFYWSPDGQSIFFIAFFQGARQSWTAYEAKLNDNSLIEHTTTDRPMHGWWNGTALLSDFTWMRPDRTTSFLNPYKNCQQMNVNEAGGALSHSSNGNWVIAAYCTNGDGWFYWVNSDGTVIKPLVNSPIPAVRMFLMPMAWSHDDKFIAFTVGSMDTSDMYILNVSEALNDRSIPPVKISNSSNPSWRPVAEEDIAKEIPTSEPTSTSSYDGLIAFTAAGETGEPDVYTVSPDGSGMTNLTNHPAQDVNPFWSPDGSRIAFESDRDGFMQIYSMDADGSNVRQLTSEDLNHELPANYFNEQSPWSPDGTRLMFLQKTSEDEKSMLYMMDMNGENKTPLFGEPDDYTALSWSPDGGHIAFISTNPQNEQVFRIYVVDREGKGLTDLTQLLTESERLDSFQYNWAADGQSVFFIAYKHISEGNDQWTAYEASLDGGQLIEHARSSTPMADWWKDTSFLTGFGLSTLTWLHADGTFNTFKPWDNCPSVNDGPYGFLARRSSHGNQIINIDCPNDDMWFYFANPDGTAVIQLLRSPLSVREGGIGNILWSSDDRFIALTISSPEKTSLYIVDIAASVQNPSIEPVQITISDGLSHYNPSWQPIP